MKIEIIATDRQTEGLDQKDSTNAPKMELLNSVFRKIINKMRLTVCVN